MDYMWIDKHKKFQNKDRFIWPLVEIGVDLQIIKYSHKGSGQLANLKPIQDRPIPISRMMMDEQLSRSQHAQDHADLVHNNMLDAALI